MTLGVRYTLKHPVHLLWLGGLQHLKGRLRVLQMRDFGRTDVTQLLAEGILLRVQGHTQMGEGLADLIEGAFVQRTTAPRPATRSPFR